MELFVGVLLALGVLLVYATVVEIRLFEYLPFRNWGSRLRNYLLKAGLDHRQRILFLIVVVGLPAFVLLISYGLTRVWPVAIAMMAAVVPLPWGWLRMRLEKRRQRFANAWPDITDSLLTAVRAGVSLPEAVVQLAVVGPETTRPFFQKFATDYRTSGRFDEALYELQRSLYDPTADRVIEVIRLSREVGGNEMGNILRDLSMMMRENLRISGEIQARQSWIVNAARLAVAAPWIVLLLISTRTDAGQAYSSATGMMVLACGGIACTFAYWLMQRLGRINLDHDRR
ncbi:type II secretion system F family protein [Gleimia sp. 6138-11-ORH1]|uniref:type II secretion system F family protein n=1 Tax=Gleimia sp. 6138-11-ORH1 TaxID=2973937 RepID=UPI002166DA06|nr:type II secretion system F family protein [Gleimia sp. 6138-11-ORH1]MCS4483983.1 type II secretion system F family protein [Gleimia sp. 6138-11-ORH1]